MKFGVYSMRDSVSGLYNTPTIEQSDIIALRSFKYAINKTDFLNFNAHDVDLFKLGEFDNSTGEFFPCAPEKICDGVSMLEKGE